MTTFHIKLNLQESNGKCHIYIIKKNKHVTTSKSTGNLIYKSSFIFVLEDRNKIERVNVSSC